MAKSIPKEVKEKVLEKLQVFNEKHKKNFQITFRKQYAYLSKVVIFFHKEETKLGRLEYKGEMDNWDFAVFRYSREFYDPDEFMFPGAEKLDGTIEGALKAGLEIYP